jgi:hypothetical protein
MPTLTIRVPRPHANQAAIVAEAGRFNVVNCGRRFGKTVMGIDRAINGRKGMLAGYPVGWFAPDYKLLRQAWRDIRAILGPIAAGARGISEQEKRIELINGGSLECWSFDRNPDAGRSRRYGTVVIDEAAHCRNLEPAWTKGIRATLTDYIGDAWFISSPNGENFFHTLYKRHREGRKGWRSWTRTSYDNPHIPGSEIDDASLDLPDWVFEQEYLAIFHAAGEDGLIDPAWIERMKAVVADVRKLRAAGKGGRKYLAADLGEGSGRDRTVICVRDSLGILFLLVSDRIGIPEAAVFIDKYAREFGVRQENIIYDAGNRGRDLPRYLEQLRITEAYPYFGSAKGGPRHYRKRDRCGWRVRQRLDPTRPVAAGAPPRDPERPPSPFDPPPLILPASIQPPFAYEGDMTHWPALVEELKALRYHLKGTQIKLENKDEMAKRLGRSPDICDAVMMSFALESE